MNVFGVGPLELLVILAVALIFVGPERLPRLAADLARTIRDIRRYTASFAAEFNEVIQEFERETEAERAEWKEIGEGLSSAGAGVQQQLEGASREVQAAAADAATSLPPPSGMPTSDKPTNGAGAGGTHAAAPVEPAERAS